MTAEDFTKAGTEWITSMATVLELFFVKVGLLAAAYWAFRKNNRELREKLNQMEARQDRHGEKLNAVALAVPPANAVQEVHVINTEPVKTEVTNTPENPVHTDSQP